MFLEKSRLVQIYSPYFQYMKKPLYILLAFLLVGSIYFFGYVAKGVDKKMNTVSNSTPLKNFSTEPELIPFIADLHCDALLWDRNLLEEADHGHIDLPRMQKANMALQFFSIVSKTPKGINIESNSSNSDMNGLLSFGQLLPPKTWFSIKERAIHQCKKMHEYVGDSNGELVLIDSKKKLEDFVANREKGNKAVAAMLGIEGAQCLEGDLANVKMFADLGVRYIGLTHFFDNEWAGSAHGEHKGGLTEKGKKLIKEMEKCGVTVDLAHASKQTIEDVFAITNGPVIISHTGIQAVCDNNRNLSDEYLDEIGRRNGLVGIGLWETAVCGKDAQATAKNIKYAVDRIGVDKVALGSDFDGAIETHFDVTGLPLVVVELHKLGFNKDDVNKIMGGNVRDYFLRNLK